MANCYVFCGVGIDGETYCTGVCANSPRWGQSQQSGYESYFAPYDGFQILRNPWATTAGSITLCTTEEQLNAALAQGTNYGNDCSSCLTNPVKYDCLNGSCVTSSTYDTPGLYDSLQECQGSCGSGCQPPNICVPPNHCPDGYVCIGADEFAQIKRELS
ncbi:hypothetical protein LC593_35845 [Nostoc sp. CHAB 5844]|nr:hypothetical protein [Nostoc sp. CHAB 5844]